MVCSWKESTEKALWSLYFSLRFFQTTYMSSVPFNSLKQFLFLPHSPMNRPRSRTPLNQKSQTAQTRHMRRHMNNRRRKKKDFHPAQTRKNRNHQQTQTQRRTRKRLLKWHLSRHHKMGKIAHISFRSFPKKFSQVQKKHNFY